MALQGPISDRIRRLFSSDDPAHTPTRETAATTDMAPADYVGVEITPPGRSGGRHRKEDR